APSMRGSDPTRVRPDRMPYGLLWGYVSRYRARYAWGVLFLLAANVFSLGIPWTVKNATASARMSASHRRPDVALVERHRGREAARGLRRPEPHRHAVRVPRH